MSETQFENATKNFGTSAEYASSSTARAVEDTIPKFAEAARATADAVRASGRKASAVMADFGEDAVDKSKQARDEVVERVKTQPIAALLIAAGVGLLAGVLLGRNR
jgi:ElaB/YqjD/DUF883 family membrane-anchored ribosome-binding protein